MYLGPEIEQRQTWLFNRTIALSITQKSNRGCRCPHSYCLQFNKAISNPLELGKVDGQMQQTERQSRDNHA